jgi:serine/threonine protein kinase
VSKVVRKGERMTEQCGTPAYIAPEILRDHGYEGFAVDIWSAGVVLFAMAYGTVPFKAGNMNDLHKLIIRAKYTLKPDVSPELRDLLRHMLEPDPRRRFTIPQILCHRWFLNYEPSGTGTFEIVVNLFTEEEKKKMDNEFTYSERANRNKQPQEGSNPTNESDWFTEQNIDCTQNDLTRNNTSKSVILAPFNSTRSHQSDLHDSLKDLIVEKKVIKLAAKVRDVDRQYEKNNNCEVDNGVYNKFAYDTPSKESDSARLNPLASNENSLEDVGSHKKEEAENDRVFSKDLMDSGPASQNDAAVQALLLKSLVPPPLVTGMVLFDLLDKIIVNRVAALGYPEDYILACLKNADRNYATTTYFLLLNH